MKTVYLFALGCCLLGVVLAVSQFQPPVAAGTLRLMEYPAGQKSVVPAVLPTATPQPCRPGEGWRWMSGDLLPDVAIQAQRALRENGIAATVSARSFGEVDSCSSYHPLAVDFTVKLQDDLSAD